MRDAFIRGNQMHNFKNQFPLFHHSNSAIFDDVKYVPTYIPTNHSDSKISIQIIENDIPRVNYIIRLNGKGPKRPYAQHSSQFQGLYLTVKKFPAKYSKFCHTYFTKYMLKLKVAICVF